MLPLFMKKKCLECSSSCPQWCYGDLFPPSGPPPPLSFPDDKSQTSPTFSPLVIAIIGILASAFLLVSYYAIISKYCGNGNSQDRRRREFQQPNNEEIVEQELNHSARHDPGQHEPWIIITPGLDEALIKSITLVTYKKGDGLVGSSDCSVCLGEFIDDDTLRLLPKCSHAFHVTCIDTWLRSHSNCPLCRANIISPFANQPLITPPNNINPPLVVDNNSIGNVNNVFQDRNTLVRNQVANQDISSIAEGRQMGFPAASMNLPKNSPFRALSDLGVRGFGGRDTIRRSISMDHRYETRVLIPDAVRYSLAEEDCVVNMYQFQGQSLKKGRAGESSKVDVCSSDSRNGVLHCVRSDVAIKRSVSSGRFLFSKQLGRGKNAVIPL